MATNYYARHSNFAEGRLRYLLQLETLKEITSSYIVLHDRYLYYDTVGFPIDRKTVVSDEFYGSLDSLQFVTEGEGQTAYISFKVVEMDRLSGASLIYHGAGA